MTGVRKGKRAWRRLCLSIAPWATLIRPRSFNWSTGLPKKKVNAETLPGRMLLSTCASWSDATHHILPLQPIGRWRPMVWPVSQTRRTLPVGCRTQFAHTCSGKTGSMWVSKACD